MTTNHIPPAICPPADWRVITHRARNGPANMAVDEAIMEAVREGIAPPTLRFYSWEPACLSLGLMQPAADIDRHYLESRGWDIVRRLTGGRAILHIDELTYSAITHLDDPRVSGGVIESYRRLSRGLLAGLEKLGASLQADKAAEGAHGFKGPICFEVPSDYEITAQGKKLLGSAQTRRGEILLQHGALPLYGDVTRICDVLVFENDHQKQHARRRLSERAITLSDALGRTVEEAPIIAALTAAFAEQLAINFEPGDLTEYEIIRAEELRAEKYSSLEWTERF